MPIQVKCADCGRTMPVKDEFAGEKGLCPFCRAALVVPDQEGGGRVRADLSDLEHKAHPDRRLELDPEEADRLQSIDKKAPTRGDRHEKLLGGFVLTAIGTALGVGAVLTITLTPFLPVILAIYGLPVLLVGIRNLILGSKMRVPRQRRVQPSAWDDEDRPSRTKWSLTTIGKVVGGVFAMSVGSFFIVLGFLTRSEVVLLSIEGAFFFLIGLVVALDGLLRPS